MSTKVCKVQWFRLLSCLRTKPENRLDVLTNDDEVREEYEKWASNGVIIHNHLILLIIFFVLFYLKFISLAQILRCDMLW